MRILTPDPGVNTANSLPNLRGCPNEKEPIVVNHHANQLPYCKILPQIIDHGAILVRHQY